MLRTPAFPLLLPALSLLMAATSAHCENPLPLQPDYPNPLVASDGTAITTKEQWLTQRAPELKALFQKYEYGQLPAAPAKVEAKVEREDPAALGSKATLREVTLTWGMPGVAIHLLLVTPHTTKPAPAFLGLSFTSVHEALADPKIAIDQDWLNFMKAAKREAVQTGEESRGKAEKVWNIEKAIDRGYAMALFYNGDVVPDAAPAANERLKLFRPAERADAPAADDCATISAWAWGLMRAMDYLVTVPELDAKRIGVVGHSRNGKTVLLAGAMDPRFALVIPSQAGCSGTAPARVSPELSTPGANGRATVETLSRINTSFPHWFCGNYKQFNDEPARLPFDQHELIALCAPRPVLVSAATEDLWANPSGQFHMVRLADPVYRLVAGEGSNVTEQPAPNTAPTSRLGYFIRPGKHEMNEIDWSAWLDFADRFLKP
jgi:hypothetical protein